MALHASSITRAAFEQVLSRYHDTLKSVGAASLDDWRVSTLRSTVTARAYPHLTSSELSQLVSCKLKRGKYRPVLLAHIASNPETLVVDTTTAAFSRLGNRPLEKDIILDALLEVCQLKGVGPATASYVLAAYRSEVPVFSDEGFRWAMFAEGESTDWERKIKYDLKEYEKYLNAVGVVANRLGARSEDVERVGYVLGKEAAADTTAEKRKRSEKDENSQLSAKKPKSKAAVKAQSAAGDGVLADFGTSRKDKQMPSEMPALEGRNLRSRRIGP